MPQLRKKTTSSEITPAMKKRSSSWCTGASASALDWLTTTDQGAFLSAAT